MEEVTENVEFGVLTDESINAIRVPVKSDVKGFLLLDSEYDEKKNVVTLTFYDVEQDKLYYHSMKSYYYCYSTLSPEKIDLRCLAHSYGTGFQMEVVERFDKIQFKPVQLTQIITEKPEQIRGIKQSVTNLLVRTEKEGTKTRIIEDYAWENKIYPQDLLCYDLNYIPGMFYTFRKMNLKYSMRTQCSKCGFEKSVFTYGYDLRDEKQGKESIVHLHTNCHNCGLELWRNEDISEEYWEVWREIIKPNPLGRIVEKKQRVPIQIFPIIDEEISNEFYSKFDQETEEYLTELKKWFPLFFAPTVNFKRVAMDIEILQDDPRQVPNVDRASEIIPAICFSDSDGKECAVILRYYNISIPDKIIDENAMVNYLHSRGIVDIVEDNLRKKKGYYVNEGRGEPWEEFSEISSETEIILCDDEIELLYRSFEIMQKYPFVITYNGAIFDLPYLYNRAIKIGIPVEDIPIQCKMVNRRYIYTLKNGMVHFDLYGWFSNRSVKSYIYMNKYVLNTLESVSNAILKKGKADIVIAKARGEEKVIANYTRNEMIYYCLTDARLTIQLTTVDNNRLFKLVMMVMRLSKMGTNTANFRTISVWIKSMLNHYHKINRYLIPQKEVVMAISEIKSESKTGKKFGGAYVKDPVVGTHFGVVVMDFASLYPSIIKLYNLSYETVDACCNSICTCDYYIENSNADQIKKKLNYKGSLFAPVEEKIDKNELCVCQYKYKLPGNVGHYVCQARGYGVFALLIGICRDVRVKWFKEKAKTDIEAEVIQSALKVYINGSYGVFGDEDFDFCQFGVGESTTGLGQFSILSAIEKAESMV
jgi:DNA polymerase elongation subunit (family B)